MHQLGLHPLHPGLGAPAQGDLAQHADDAHGAALGVPPRGLRRQEVTPLAVRGRDVVLLRPGLARFHHLAVERLHHRSVCGCEDVRGAAAKGATLLNYCGLGPDVIDYVVDRNSHKQGLYMPGVQLPIGPPTLLTERPPDYLLILAWNLADEITRQQAAYRAAGGRFILPIPEVRVIEDGRA